MATARPLPTSTYRLQLHQHFTFDDAAAIVPYLASLGVTDLYLSPVVAATHGSMPIRCALDVAWVCRVGRFMGSFDV